jgi:hypothetical protein
VIVVHRAVGGGIEHLLALPGRHLAQHAEGAAYLLLARGIHAAKLLRGVTHSLAAVRAQPLHVLDPAEGALALLGRHGVELVQAIDEPLLLLLRQAVESRLATQRIFLAGEGLPLMALQPIAEVGATHISRRCGVGTARRLIRDCSVRGAKRRSRSDGRGGKSIGSDAVRARGIAGRSATVCGCAIGRRAVGR